MTFWIIQAKTYLIFASVGIMWKLVKHKWKGWLCVGPILLPRPWTDRMISCKIKIKMISCKIKSLMAALSYLYKRVRRTLAQYFGEYFGRILLHMTT